MKRYLCKCGCGKFAKLGNRFINHHNWKGHDGRPHTEETKRKIGRAHRGKVVSEESKEKNRQAHLGKRHIKESINKMRKVKLGKKFSESHKEKIRVALTGVKHSKERRKKNSEGVKRVCQNPEYVKKMSERQLKLWSNPEYREKQLKVIFIGNNISPTKPERRLRNRLNHLFPDEWKYVGDGNIWIGGKCPDFINVNGQKKIIEMFGNYWHGKKRTKRTKHHEEQRRIRHFAKYGFRTLIVWQSELRNIRRLRRKLIRFDRIQGS